MVQANDATVVAPTRDSLRRELKAWERAFLAKHGRQPQPDDLKSEPLISAFSLIKPSDLLLIITDDFILNQISWGQNRGQVH